MMTADLNLIETEEDAEYTTCDNCNESVLMANTDDDCFCPACHALRLQEISDEAKEEAINEAQGEVEEAESDLESLEAEMEELREKIRDAKVALKAARKKRVDLD